MNQRSSGLRLSEEFYKNCVAPALAAEFPRLPHAAGLMGRGSEVLGYDDSMSTDHTWSARVTVFVPAEVLAEEGELVRSQVTARIPDLFEGVPTEVEVTAVQQYFLTSSVWTCRSPGTPTTGSVCASRDGAGLGGDLDAHVDQNISCRAGEI